MGVKLDLSHYENNLCAERVSGSKRKTVRESCGKVRALNLKHNNMYSSKNTSTIIVSMIRRRMGYVARMTEYTEKCQMLVKN